MTPKFLKEKFCIEILAPPTTQIFERMLECSSLKVAIDESRKVKEVKSSYGNRKKRHANNRLIIMHIYVYYLPTDQCDC